MGSSEEHQAKKARVNGPQEGSAPGAEGAPGTSQAAGTPPKLSPLSQKPAISAQPTWSMGAVPPGWDAVPPGWDAGAAGHPYPPYQQQQWPPFYPPPEVSNLLPRFVLKVTK